MTGGGGGRRRRTAVLISGRGSNMAALLEAAARDPGYPAEISLVLSNRADAAGLALARAAGVPAAAVESRGFRGDREAFERAVEAELARHEVELVALAARVLAQEHRIYPAALAWLAAGRVRVEGGRAVVTAAEGAPGGAALLNPLPGPAALPTDGA